MRFGKRALFAIAGAALASLAKPIVLRAASVR